MVIAIIAPEIVLYAAFEQWFLSRGFLKKLKWIAEENTDEQFQLGRAVLEFWCED